jgi:mono/diheme cytochrome c family protein
MAFLPLMEPQGEAGRTSTWTLLAAGIGVPLVLIGAIPVVYSLTHPEAPAASASMVKMASTAPASSSSPAAKTAAASENNPGLMEFRQHVLPILKDNCYDCHGDGKSKGGVAFDQLTSDDQLLKNPELWLKVLNNTRAGIMPADGNPRLTAKDQATLDHWIKFTAFGVDPQNFDPGRVTIHRLNRFEYRNTIHDLLGVDYDTSSAFPSDDIGYGFDNIADVLNVSPMLMEKYLAAAQNVVGQAVPVSSRVIPAVKVLGRDFVDANTGRQPPLDTRTFENGKVGRLAISTSYFDPLKAVTAFNIASEGDYRVVMEEGISSNFAYVAANCTATIFVDGQPMSQKVISWHGANSNSEKQESFYETIPVHWAPGRHEVTIAVEPLSGTFNGKDNVYFLVRSVTIEGPTDESKWVRPANYNQFFTRDEAPADPAARRAYAREALGAFATKAYRHPVPEDTLDRLTDLAEKEYSQPGRTFEKGVAQAMVAVLASPRFLFRIDKPETVAGQLPQFAPVDEYSLASRLSYFLWSTMPDDELIKLAAAGQLRKNLAAQVQRMVADPKADGLIQNFSEQWLQSRAVLTVPLNPGEIFLRQGLTYNPDLTVPMRNALNQEAQAYFGYVLRNDRSVNEFLESNYTFLNQTLAGYYALAPELAAGIRGDDMRKVDLPEGDWRGGVLTMGSVLMVTSNPTRTSVVKRGKWVLDNILGAPAPPPPPDIPPLEEPKKVGDREPTMREVLAAHRASPQCSSCHDRMDPLGFALENFNALGLVRESELDQPIDTSSRLSSGEAFKDIRELKHILATNHREEFYRCLTEKLLTYALGRGVEYYDVPAVDKIVESLDKNDGRFSALLMGIIDSVPFQQERTFTEPHPTPAKPSVLLTQNTPAHANSSN